MAGRIHRYLLDCKADAWVFYSANRTILEMAAMLPVPAYALGGLSDGLPLAGSRADLTIPMQACVDALVARKHRRIVLISPPGAREPQPNRHARVFLDRLQHHGIRADVHFSLPDWEHSPDGLNVLLRSLFSVTPPSALLVMEPECLGPTLVFLASRGLRVPRDVSVVNLLPDPMQAFYRPVIAHFKWAVQPHTRRLCQWLSAIAVNRPDHRMQTTAPAFCPAESIGTHHTP